MSLSVDSLNIKYQDDINTNISRLAIQAKTSPVIDTTAVIPMTAQLKFDYLRTRLPDSVWLVAGQTVMKGGIKSSASNKRIPTAGATISVDTPALLHPADTYRNDTFRKHIQSRSTPLPGCRTPAQACPTDTTSQANTTRQARTRRKKGHPVKSKRIPPT